MKAKRIISFLLCTVLFPFVFSACNKKTPAEIRDVNGNVIATITSFEPGVCETDNESLNAYIDIVKEEAVEALCSELVINEKEAKKRILTEGYAIRTYFEPDAFARLESAASSEYIKYCNAALSASTPDGRLVAVYSKSMMEDEYINFATEKTPPYSAIKPLSVYAPAIDSGILNWSSMLEDSPVKQVLQADGEYYDWPTNASGTYSMADTTVKTALQKSLNTVAVRALLEYGANDSVSFMENKFGIDLTYEKQVSASFGEEEILSAIALGYLNKGVSPVDMSGYYQIFATGGKYAKPRTIDAITSTDCFCLYYDRRTDEYSQVIEESTAYIMNKLLQTVVEPGGTGEAARLENIPLAAKTGTGENYAGNWFIGVTPSFCISVWHDSGADKNRAAEVFKLAADGFSVSPCPDAYYENEENEILTEFPVCDEVTEAAYCKESGCLLGDGCRQMDVGYFWKRQMPEKCSGH